MRRYNHRLRLKQYISQTGMHSRTGYICFAFLHYAGAYLMKVMKVRYIICQSVCWVMTQGLGGEGEVLGKLLASRQTPFIGLYQSQLRTQHQHQHHTGGVAKRGAAASQSIRSQKSIVKLHRASVGLYHTQHQHQAGGGKV